MGSTGDPPVPVGDPPTGRARRPLPQGPSLLGSGALPVPPGESPGETGQWPTALELGESTALFSLSSDGGGGEGRGEESRFYLISPLPNPLPARSSQGEGDRRPAFQCLIPWHSGPRPRLEPQETGSADSPPAKAPGRHSWVRVASETHNCRLVVFPMAAAVSGSIVDYSWRR